MIFGFSRNAVYIFPNEFTPYWIQDIPESIKFTKIASFRVNLLKNILYHMKIKLLIVRFRVKEFTLNT